MEPIYFSKFEFTTYQISKQSGIVTDRIVCNIPYKELSYQEFDRDGEVTYYFAHHLTDAEISKILPYIDIHDFEPFRNKEMNISDPHAKGYLDEFSMSFRGISDSSFSLIELPMDIVYDDAHTWPNQKLYDYISSVIFSEKPKAGKKCKRNKQIKF